MLVKHAGEALKDLLDHVHSEFSGAPKNIELGFSVASADAFHINARIRLSSDGQTVKREVKLPHGAMMGGDPKLLVTKVWEEVGITLSGLLVHFDVKELPKAAVK